MQWDMPSEFTCSFSGRQVRGFKHLDAMERRRLCEEKLVAPHIQELAKQILPKVELRLTGSMGKSLYLAEPAPAGSTVLQVPVDPAQVVTQAVDHCIQIGQEEYLVFGSEASRDAYWYVNHHEEPNLR